MSTPPTEEMRRLADGLLHWIGTSYLGAKDVAIWFNGPKRIGVAFIGPALTLQRNFDHTFNNKRYYLDLALQRAVGLSGETHSGHPDMQTMDEPDPYLASVFEGVEQVVTEALGGDDVIERVYATLLPDDGAPWAPQNDPTPWYSAKKQRVFVTQRPEWLMEIELEPSSRMREEYRTDRLVVANICELAPKLDRCGTEVVGRLPEHGHFDFLVTHAFDVGHRRHTMDAEATAKTIRQCGGLIFPSLAVSMVPATQFGTVVLVAGVDLALAGLKPYRKRGRWPVVVYSTDAWTTTTTEVMTYGARMLYEELTGQREFGVYSQGHFWTLGAPIASGGPGGEEAKLLPGTKQLATGLLRRARIWPRGLTQAQMQELKNEHAMKHTYYPLLEGKVHGVLSMRCFPLAVMPQARASVAKQFLSTAGFTGTIIELPVEPSLLSELDEGSDAASWEYAWSVRDAVIAYAEQKPNERIFAVDEA